MKKVLVFLLSVVMMISVAGCNELYNYTSKEDVSETTIQPTESTEDVKIDDKTKQDKAESTSEKSKEVEEKTEAKATESITEAGKTAKKDKVTEERKTEEQKKEEETTTEAPRTTEEPKPEKPETPTTEEITTEEPKPPVVEVVDYSPSRVVSLAISKCQAGGMITTTDNLNRLLQEGKITQEEYDEYYPYDGLGYYSVFVETDLNKASTTSGRRLGSEDAIADYISSMLLLESDPIFNISYAGTYSKNGTSFYEFRCYR